METSIDCHLTSVDGRWDGHFYFIEVMPDSWLSLFSVCRYVFNVGSVNRSWLIKYEIYFYKPEDKSANICWAKKK